MSEVSDPLYNKALLRLAADAVGAGRLEAPDASATVANPACGDHVSVSVRLAGGRIAALAHQTQGCILTQASAAALAAAVLGLDRASIVDLETRVRHMLKDGAPPPLPAYAVFDGATALPGRHVCVLLPLRALAQALEATEPGA